MSDSRLEVKCWPGMAELRTQFAAAARRTAVERSAETGWTPEETASAVRAAAVAHARVVADELVAASEMSLDLWAVTG